VAHPKQRQTLFDPDRRRLLMRLGGITLACGLPRGLTASPNELAPIMRPIPRSGELLPAIGLGTAWAFDVGPGDQDRARLREVMEIFTASPGRLIDTSPMYGNAESVIGDLCSDLGACASLFMATKVWTEGAQEGRRQMQASMRRLHRERLDLIQVHNLVDWKTHLPILREWRQQGRIRYLGITHYRTDRFADLERVLRTEDLDFIQLNYSIITREAEHRLLPLAQDRGVAVIVNRPFEKGALFRRTRGRSLPPWAADFDCASWGQFFLKFILSHPAVTCPIPSTGNPAHMMDNLAAGRGRLPAREQREKMAAFYADL